MLERRELMAVVTVYGQSNIFGASLGAPPDPGGGGAGILPTEVDLSALGNPSTLDFPTVTGTVSARAVTGLFNGPDGGPYFGGSTNLRSVGGISGIQDNHATMFLVGVFLGPVGQPATPPPFANVSGANAQASFSPLLGQQFFVGDGRTAAEVLQSFRVPAGASRLFLGFADGYQFGTPDPRPGSYGDNGGALTVTVARPVELDVDGVVDAKKTSLGGLVVLSSNNNDAPRAEITVEPSTADLLLTETNSKVSIYTAPLGGKPLAFNGTDNLFPKNGPAEHLYVQGDQFSSTMRDVELDLASKVAGQGADSAKFTVFWVDQPIVATSGTLSADNTARDKYVSWTQGNTDKLGLQLYNTTYSARMGWGTEARATVYPNNFSYPGVTLTLARDGMFHDWIGNGTGTTYKAVYSTLPAANDTGNVIFQDDIPSSRGVIYDFDAPGLYIPVAPKGEIQRARYDFRAFATITLPGNVAVRASLVTNYFVDFSMRQVDGPEGSNWVAINPPDVANDDQAGNGSRNVSWNLL